MDLEFVYIGVLNLIYWIELSGNKVITRYQLDIFLTLSVGLYKRGILSNCNVLSILMN